MRDLNPFLGSYTMFISKEKRDLVVKLWIEYNLPIDRFNDYTDCGACTKLNNLGRFITSEASERIELLISPYGKILAKVWLAKNPKFTSIELSPCNKWE